MAIVFDTVVKLIYFSKKHACRLGLAVLSLSIIACTAAKEELDADQVINKAILEHGGIRYDNMSVEFDFRDRHFKALIKNGKYVYESTFQSEDGWVKDVYQNDSFKRIVNEKEIELNIQNRADFQNATNSVIYFALLPFHLDDPVINRQLMRSVRIKGEPYFKVEVTFGDGGGERFENAYIYWIHKEHFTVDFFAYSFNVNGGGVRFREATDVQIVEGIRFQNYNNYTIEEDYPAHELDYAFEQDRLRLISEINLENVQVSLLED